MPDRTRRGATPPVTLSNRALNRATLERQMLLCRAALSVPDAVAQLVGVNAQEANSAYVGLWTRLEEFELGALTRAIEDREVVRSVLMRGTQHLVRAEDFSWLRPVLQPLLTRLQRNAFGRRTAGVNLDELVDTARELLAGRTLTRPELGRLLDERWPGIERGALAWSVQYLEAVLHPAPSGTWGVRGATPYVLASDWLGPLDGVGDAERLVRRYLAAYGPATVADIRTWSGVSGLGEVVDGLRPQLAVYRDEAGRELFDLPDAPRPDPEIRALLRFLPEFDNLVLAHADRSRMMSEEIRQVVCVGDGVAATVLLGGTVRAMWGVVREDEDATLVVETLGRWSLVAGRQRGARGGRRPTACPHRSRRRTARAARSRLDRGQRVRHC